MRARDLEGFGPVGTNSPNVTSGHTPGPWFISRSCMGVHKYVEARIGGGMIQEVACCGPTEKHEQSDANARLIAAAPDLLEASRLFVKAVDADYPSQSDDCIYDSLGSVYAAAYFAARQALSKATP